MEVTDNGDGEPMDDITMDQASSQAPDETNEVAERANKSVKSSQTPGSRLARSVSVDMVDDEKGDSSTTSSVPTPQSGPPSTATSDLPPIDAHPRPPIDEQVAQVTRLIQQPPIDKQKGYVVDKQWLNRAVELGTGISKSSKQSKATNEESLGPVDNSRLHVDADPTNTFMDECGKRFTPLKPGLQIGEDFEVTPQEAWELILKWYGTTASSPIITRYCHNTSTNEIDPNPQYEVYPPIFTILKLPDRSGGITPASLQEKDARPVKILASRHEVYQRFLARAKRAAGIPLTTKVRLWRILVGFHDRSRDGILTPAQSRSPSPLPTVTNPVDPGDHLVMDMNDFIALQEGSQRELLDTKDESMNEKFNGRSNLAFVGLSQEGIIVLEEQVQGPAGGEWVSAAVTADWAKNGVVVSVTQNGSTAVSNSLKPKPDTSHGKAGSSLTGMMTRGRAQKNGKPRGVVGLGNLGNTCYMNSALQCVRSVEELTQYFLSNAYKKELNPGNLLGHNGEVAKVYASLLKELYSESPSSSFSPRNFKTTIGKYGPSFSGYGQQDSQEFLLFLLDGLQEDLNRIDKKPYIEKPDSTDEMVHNPAALRKMADTCWEIYKARNDSVVTDLFAGMYKSTVVCPVCDKVSIIFDPFNNLTLQLPIENAWTKKVFYFPLNAPPLQLTIDMDKNATFAALKEYVAKCGNTDAKRLIVVEIYKNRFFKHFQDRKSVGEESVQENDSLGVYELERIPTNWPPVMKPPRVRSMLYQNSDSEEELPDAESERAEDMLVSLFHRVQRGPTMEFALVPMFIVVNKQEAQDYHAIFRKVLAAVAPMTTKDLFEACSPNDREDSDTVLMTTDDADSSDSKLNATSVEGDDEMLEISMKHDTKGDDLPSSPASHDSQASRTTSFSQPLPQMLGPQGTINPMLSTFFEMQVWHGPTMVPFGLQAMEREPEKFRPLASRAAKPKGRFAKRDLRSKSILERSGSMSSDSSDEPTSLSTNHLSFHRRLPEDGDRSDSDSSLPAVAELRALNGTSRSLHRFKNNQPSRRQAKRKLITYARKGKSTAHPNAEESNSEDEAEAETEGDGGPLLRPGDAIVLDWFPDVVVDLFSGQSSHPKAAFHNTFDSVPTFVDPELDEKRRVRAHRKKHGVSLGDCLDEFGKSEVLSENDAWYCPRCKAHRRATKKFELWKSPDILVIHLKRFSAQGRLRDKLDVLVDFPVDGLDLSERVIVKDDGKSMLYDLFAVDNHYGGLGGGHYTAYAKNFFSHEWYDYNDSQATRKSNPQQVVTSAAYLLFYRRQSSHPLGGPLMEEIVNTANQPSEDAAVQSTSRNQSPSTPAGEGMRLDDFSHSNGSSSAYHEAGAVRQAGDGGLEEMDALPRVARIRDHNDHLPGYSILPPDDDHTMQSTEMEEDAYPIQSLELINQVATQNRSHGIYPSALAQMQQPSWNFSSAHLATNAADENDVDDHASMRACSSGSSMRARSLASSMGDDGLPEFGTPAATFETPQGSMEEDSRSTTDTSPRLGVVEDQDGPVADIMLDEPEDGP